MTDPILVSVKEAARLVGLSAASMYELCDKQEVVSVYRGRRRLVNHESLKAWAEALPRFPEADAS